MFSVVSDPSSTSIFRISLQAAWDLATYLLQRELATLHGCTCRESEPF